MTVNNILADGDIGHICAHKFVISISLNSLESS